MFRLPQPVPATRLFMLQAKLVGHAGHNMLGNVIGGLRVVVVRRHGRHHRHAHAGERQHVLQMNGAERRFTGHQYQLTPLFQHHIRRTAHQPFGIARADPGQRFHAAGNDDHAVGTKRAGGDGGGLVSRAVDDVSQGSNVLGGVRRFQLNGGFCPLRHHQMRLYFRHFPQRLQQHHAQRSTRRPRHSHDQSHSSPQSICSCTNIVGKLLPDCFSDKIVRTRSHKMLKNAALSSWTLAAIIGGDFFCRSVHGTKTRGVPPVTSAFSTAYREVATCPAGTDQAAVCGDALNCRASGH
ncbi:hypothetical protein COLO4_01769 [Corchorus olitorius]|uniref:Uncharacterized protein n=1 Tax=Corchorus olitorius TaxID=93759 RepID=A0A1R3L228_9ROSI|nr:hypothetical protein COLO4_01769 [Corchorus olitorius]